MFYLNMAFFHLQNQYPEHRFSVGIVLCFQLCSFPNFKMGFIVTCRAMVDDQKLSTPRQARNKELTQNPLSSYDCSRISENDTPTRDSPDLRNINECAHGRLHAYERVRHTRTISVRLTSLFLGHDKIQCPLSSEMILMESGLQKTTQPRLGDSVDCADATTPSAARWGFVPANTPADQSSNTGVDNSLNGETQPTSVIQETRARRDSHTPRLSR